MKLTSKINNVTDVLNKFKQGVDAFWYSTPEILNNVSSFIKNDLKNIIVELEELSVLAEKLEEYYEANEGKEIE